MVDVRNVFRLLTSNGVEATVDFANRSSIIRLRQRHRHTFRRFDEGRPTLSRCRPPELLHGLCFQRHRAMEDPWQKIHGGNQPGFRKALLTFPINPKRLALTFDGPSFCRE
jgi:hypothetical protein